MYELVVFSEDWASAQSIKPLDEKGLAIQLEMLGSHMIHGGRVAVINLEEERIG